ncbi:MAG: UPF0149 family protein [Opitutaceae bacterium]|nr:UPF0149 family protein [Opitutaceae bacterium]
MRRGIGVRGATMAQTFKGWIGRDLDEHGMAWAILVRERTGGWCELGAFLVDAWCLGVKDAYYDELPADEVQAFLDDQLPADMREEVEPACVRALVEGAVAYAQSLGFLPHRDYRKARKVFGPLKATDCTRVFTFGRGGRPCFMAGPDDDEARINRVLAVLTARLGADGFDFVDPADEEAREDEVIEPLYRFIEDGRCPDRAYSGHEAYGFLTGTCLLPDAVEPAAWPVAFWGGESAIPAFRDAAEAEAITAAILALREQIARDLEDGAYDIGLPEVGDADRERFARRCCAGFLRGLALVPKVLAWLRGHPEGAAAVSLLERTAGGEATIGESCEDEMVDAILRLDELARELIQGSDTVAGG